MAITLRTLAHAQATTKNDTLTASEFDQNFIDLIEDMNLANGNAQIPAYDETEEYRKDRFVSYLYEIYRYINDTPATAIVPTNTTYWKLSSVLEFLTNGNFITKTKTQIFDDKQNEVLKRGFYYLVDDLDGYKILLFAISESQFALEILSWGSVPDYNLENPDSSYSDVVDFVSNLGIWKDTRGTLDYDNLHDASFTVGETITGGTSGATAEILDDNYTASPPGGTLTLINIVGTFQNDEEITGSLSPQAVADVDGTVTYTFNPQTGHVVIYNHKHYRKKTDSITSTAPPDDAASYEYLEKDGSFYGYVEEVTTGLFYTKTDYAASPTPTFDDWYFIEIKDRNGNIVKGQTNIANFPFGNDNLTGNTIDYGTTFTALNFYGQLRNTRIEGERVLDLNLSESIIEAEVYETNKICKLLLSQTGTNAPTAIVKENTLDGTIVWTRSAEGFYIGTLTGAFPMDRTFILHGTEMTSNDARIQINRITNDTIGVYTYNGATLQDLIDGELAKTSIFIEIFPA